MGYITENRIVCTVIDLKTQLDLLDDAWDFGCRITWLTICMQVFVLPNDTMLQIRVSRIQILVK